MSISREEMTVRAIAECGLDVLTPGVRRAFRKGARAIESGEARIRVFDWALAEKIISERKPKVAIAGLIDDWATDHPWTSGVIWRDGERVKSECVYLSSYWATPGLLLRMDGRNRRGFYEEKQRHAIPCWRFLRDGESFPKETPWPSRKKW
jgi:hypothetical protein